MPDTFHDLIGGTMAIDPTLTHECPKCSGARKLHHFGHIHNGTCFLCAGAGRVSERTASSWLASQSGGFRTSGTTRPSTRVARQSKVVDLGEFGKVTITALEDGVFSATDILVTNDEGEVGDYHLSFAVTGGRVVVDAGYVQNGMRNHWRRVQAALQGALRA